MKKEELVDIIKELYRLWNTEYEHREEDIDFILSKVIKKIKEGE